MKFYFISEPTNQPITNNCSILHRSEMKNSRTIGKYHSFVALVEETSGESEREHVSLVFFLRKFPSFSHDSSQEKARARSSFCFLVGF